MSEKNNTEEHKSTNNSAFVLEELVLSGGGSKGIGFIGAFQALEDFGLINNIKTIYGVSVGSIIATALCTGMTSKEMYEILMEFDLAQLKNVSLFKIISHYGIDSGNKLMEWITSILDKKYPNSKKLTLKHFHELTGKRLVIVSTNLSMHKAVYMDYLTHPNLLLLSAIRMSIALPFFFTAVRYRGKQHPKQECIYVDGGLLDNFPIMQTDPKKTLGLKLIAENESELNNYHAIDNIESFATNVIFCTLNEIYKLKSPPEYDDRIITIDTKSTGIINFSLTQKDKLRLVAYGYISTRDYLLKRGLKPVKTSTPQLPSEVKTEEELSVFEKLLLPRILETLPVDSKIL